MAFYEFRRLQIWWNGLWFDDGDWKSEKLNWNESAFWRWFFTMIWYTCKLALMSKSLFLSLTLSISFFQCPSVYVCLSFNYFIQQTLVYTHTHTHTYDNDGFRCGKLGIRISFSRLLVRILSICRCLVWHAAK